MTRQQCWDGCAALADHDPPCDHYAAYYKELDKTYSCLYFNGCKTDVFTFDFRLGDQFTYWSWPESTTPEIPVGSEVETPEAVKKSKKKSKKKPKKVGLQRAHFANAACIPCPVSFYLAVQEEEEEEQQEKEKEGQEEEGASLEEATGAPGGETKRVGR